MPPGGADELGAGREACGGADAVGRAGNTTGPRLRPGLGQLTASGALVVLLGCQQSLPTAPSDLVEGLIVYEHVDYGGASAHVTRDIEDLNDFKGPCLVFQADQFGGSVTEIWNDCISSIRVAAGWRARLYRHDDFDGARLDVSTDISDLRNVPGPCDKGGFNDCVTSIEVLRP